MQYDMLLKDEKRKMSNLIKYDFVKLNFSYLKLILDSNYNEPRWMDIYILLYKANLPKDIIAYDILLEKLSKPLNKFYFKRDGKRYIVNADENMYRAYTRFLITNEIVEYNLKSQFMPDKEYIKEIIKFNKYKECGIYINHINENEFALEPINYKFDNIDDAKQIYEKIFDGYDLFKNLKLKKNNFLENFESCVELGKDKRMIATLSMTLSYFDCDFEILEEGIYLTGSDIKIDDESSADIFYAKLIDAYHFFRNVVNATNKKDIISEIYNKKVSEEIRKEFEKNIPRYLKIIEQKDLIDTIVAISKESNYTLPITFDEQGVFNIDGNLIVTPKEANEYYNYYMDTKKEHVSLAEYKPNLITRIKKVWSVIKSKFGKKTA
ncbi:MAG: hypothetical protein IKK43_00790 [Clostridia bacterium]|nr:hypothetical protein [Clostridia bacterium]